MLEASRVMVINEGGYAIIEGLGSHQPPTESLETQAQIQ